MAGPQNPIVIGDDSNDQDARQDAPQKVSPDVIEIEDDQDRPVMPGQWNFDDVEEIEQFPEDLEAPASVSTQEVCKAHVKSVFPNISLVYLDQVTAENNYNSDAAIGAILDHQEKGETYPLEPRDLKRKRKEDGGAGSEDDDEVDEGDEGAKVDSRTIRATRKKVDDFNYRLHTIKKASYADMAKNLLASDFPKVPVPIIKNLLRENRGSIFETYTKMDEAIRSWDNSKPPWAEKQRLSKKMISFLPENLQDLDMGAFNDVEQAAIAELRAARELKDLKDAEIAREREEEKNFTRAKSAGETMECGCCFDEFPLNRMVHCNGDTVHWFCKNCMKTQAETNIGLSKYELTCMSMDGCEAGFSLDQTKLFLNKKLRVALERLEQEASLRMAGIENLESCPFCPYAAEYPPIDVDKEFTCVNPGCEKVSCRLCHKETHIPKTCAEAAVDHGLDARHALEEAMSEALIRRCNNCGNPYLKLNGCNKIYCTKCGKMQCYVCRQTIVDYKHFDDASRGGKNGQCPLFDKTEERHEQEVQRAEEEARQKMLQDNSNITEDALKINISDQVLHDDAKRRRKTQTHGDPAIAEEARNMNNRLLDIRRVAWEQMRHAPAQPVGGPQFVGQDLLPHIMQGNRAARNIPLLPIAPIPAPMPAGIPVGLPMGGYPQQPGAFRGAPVIPPAMNNPFAGMALPQPGAPPLPIPPGGITLDEARVHLLHRFMRNGIPRPPPAERPNPVHLPRHEPQDRGKRNINRRH